MSVHSFNFNQIEICISKCNKIDPFLEQSYLLIHPYALSLIPEGKITCQCARKLVTTINIRSRLKKSEVASLLTSMSKHLLTFLESVFQPSVTDAITVNFYKAVSIVCQLRPLDFIRCCFKALFLCRLFSLSLMIFKPLLLSLVLQK